MPFITREDGERFIIPSYRDVLSAKKAVLLRKEILLLSSSYGEYVAIQRKSTNQYEVAFSPDPGYLLGESVWNYFKRPQDLVYCEAIPNTSEAILVIVKSGSVFLDGVFPVDVIPDELLVFRTQQNYFDIYVQGDVPISKTPAEDKFTFDSSSVKSFTELENPIFPTLPTVKAFQLLPVLAALKAKGIGVFPVKNVLAFAAVLGLVWVGWLYISSHEKELPQVIVRATNPFIPYINALNSPDPAEQIHWLVNNIGLLLTIPGWFPQAINLSDDTLNATVKSSGAKTDLLFDWAAKNHAYVQIQPDGFHLIMETSFSNRPRPKSINYINHVVARVVDNLSYTVPGNNLEVGALIDRGRFAERTLKINFNGITLPLLDTIGQQLKSLPLVLVNVSITVASNGFLSGSINLRTLGN